MKKVKYLLFAIFELLYFAGLISLSCIKYSEKIGPVSLWMTLLPVCLPFLAANVIDFFVRGRERLDYRNVDRRTAPRLIIGFVLDAVVFFAGLHWLASAFPVRIGIQILFAAACSLIHVSASYVLMSFIGPYGEEEAGFDAGDPEERE